MFAFHLKDTFPDLFLCDLFSYFKEIIGKFAPKLFFSSHIHISNSELYINILERLNIYSTCSRISLLPIITARIMLIALKSPSSLFSSTFPVAWLFSCAIFSAEENRDKKRERREHECLAPMHRFTVGNDSKFNDALFRLLRSQSPSAATSMASGGATAARR